jgi:predicted branched-subunit amino acid permease
VTATDVHDQHPAARPDPPIRGALDDITPFAVALIPFGLAVGAASAHAGLSATTALFGAVVLLAGAAQLAAIEVLGADGGIVSMVVVAGLVNLRFVFYGAGVATWFEGLPLRRRLLLAFPIVDQTFMLCQRRFEHQPDLAWRQRYYLTATAVLAGVFVGSQVIAYQMGSNLPDGLGLHLAPALAFAGLLANGMQGRSQVIAGAMAASIVIVGAGPLGQVALPLGVIVGVAAGTVATRRSTTVTTSDPSDAVVVS